jgi:hypothetical protein
MRLVLVEWLDSFGCSNNWQALGDDDLKPEIPVCRSVGWLRHDGEECKVIVPHLATATAHTEAQGCGDMTIPARAILRLVDLLIPEPAALAAA